MTNKFVTRGSEVALEHLIENTGAVIGAGDAGDLEVPYDIYLEEVTLLAEPSGSIKIDIWMDAYGNYPPTNADTITGGNEPEIVAGTKDQDSSLTGWTRELPKGRTLRFNVDSCTTVTRLAISLKGIRT